MTWLVENYKSVLGFIAGGIIAILLQPRTTTTENFHVVTKTETKVVTKTLNKSKCVAKVEIVPGGKTTIQTMSDNSQENSLDTKTGSKNEVSSVSSIRGITLGVSTYLDTKNPLKVSKELIELSIGVPIIGGFSLVGGYRLDNTFKLGVQLQW